MSSFRALAAPRERLPGALPALLVLALGLGVVLLRPPLPIDETRYLEVCRESLAGSPLLLRLCGEPYAEKPPLLFWLARALGWLALPSDFALRCLPAVASALCVLLVARLGRRVGLELAGWMQAALWIPTLAAQFLFFDPLLAATVWGAVVAWVEGRERWTWGWSAAALLAKGPVALLFLVAFFWSFSTLATERRGLVRHGARILGLALIPLAAWAVSAAILGGPEFAAALLWDRWAGRVAGGAKHARSFFYYVPIVLVGSLPATFLLFRGAEGHRPEWYGRLGRALLGLLVAFTLIRGKQPHYLVPAAPGLALFLAWRLEKSARAPRWLRAGLWLQLSLVFLAAAAGMFALHEAAPSVTAEGLELISRGAYRLPLAIVGLAALGGLFVAWRGGAPRTQLVAALLGASASLLPLQWLAGRMLFPSTLAATLQRARGEVAFFRNDQHGLYALLAARMPERLDDERDLSAWGARHPEGLILVDASQLSGGIPAGLEAVAQDTVHRSRITVLRARRGP